MLPAYRAFLAGKKMRTEFTRPDLVTFLGAQKGIRRCMDANTTPWHRRFGRYRRRGTRCMEGGDSGQLAL